MRNANTTLANWQEPDENKWAFSHVRELIPTERISRGEGPPVPFELGEPLDLDRISFDAQGRTFSVREALDATHTDAVVVLHHGRIVFEEYGPEMSRSQTHILMSVSKSVTSTLTGILVGEGLLRTSDLVTDHIATLVGTSLEGCTVQNLLDMRGGVRCSEDYADLHADVRIYEQVAGHRPRTDVGPTENLYDYMATLAPRGEHGGTFDYQSILTDILGWVLESCAGMTFAQLVSDRIWSKMGAQYDAEVRARRRRRLRHRPRPRAVRLAAPARWPGERRPGGAGPVGARLHDDERRPRERVSHDDLGRYESLHDVSQLLVGGGP